MFITYRRINGIEYGYLEESYRKDGRVCKKSLGCLGRVLDKERCIFRNRKYGVYRYELSTNTRSMPPADFVESKKDCASRYRGELREKKILQFGDVYFLDSLLDLTGLRKCIEAAGTACTDLLTVMIFYYLIEDDAPEYAEIWYRGSYAGELYPEARPSILRISSMLEALGNEQCCRAFFEAYFSKLQRLGASGRAVMLDCSIVPNSARLPLTALSHHDGSISAELRLICAADPAAGLPLYLKYVPGNAVDVQALKSTTAYLQEQGAEIDFAVLDAGSGALEDGYSLLENGIDFISRLEESSDIYQSVFKEHSDSLCEAEHVVKFNQRIFFIKKVPYNCSGRTLYVFLCRDAAQQAIEQQLLLDSLSRAEDADILDKESLVSSLKRSGTFMLLSSCDLKESAVLPAWYTRQEFEQLFGLSASRAALTVPAVQSEDVFRGYLLLSFIAAVLTVKIRMLLGSESGFTVKSALKELRLINCKVYDKSVVPQDFTSRAAEILSLCGVKRPQAEITRSARG